MYAILFVIKCEIVIKWDTDLCNNTNSNKIYYFYEQMHIISLIALPKSLYELCIIVCNTIYISVKMVESVNAWRGVIRCIINFTCNLLLGFSY